MADSGDERAPHPLDYISRDAIQDLWGVGYTIVKRMRHPDPFHVPDEMVPQGRAYQWMHLVHDKFHYENGGWAAVPASRHEGLFMPFGHVGDIEVNGLGLFEKPKFEVDADRAQQHAKAHEQVDAWKEKWGGQFSGEVSVGGERTEVGATKSIEDTTAIPRDMVPYIGQIFEERDRLYSDLQKMWEGDGVMTEDQAGIIRKYNEALDEDPTILKGPAFNALLMPYAIANIRNRIKQEASNGD